MDSERSRAPASRFWYWRKARRTPSASAAGLLAGFLRKFLQFGRQERAGGVHRQEPYPRGAGGQYLETAVGALPDGGRVRDAAHLVEGLERVVAEPGRGTALRQRRLVRHAGCGVRGLVAVTDGDDGEPARFVLGGLQQFAHHGAIALLENVQGKHETREQYRVQGEEREPDGGHDVKA